jgi:hypothetical protein
VRVSCQSKKKQLRAEQFFSRAVLMQSRDGFHETARKYHSKASQPINKVAFSFSSLAYGRHHLSVSIVPAQNVAARFRR